MKKAYCMILLAFMISAVPIMVPKGLAQTTNLFVDPANVQNISVGNSFNVTLKVADVSDLFTWQIKILWNASVLQCEKAFYATSNYVFPGSQIPVAPSIDNTTGNVVFGASLIGAGPGFSGSGSLCTLTFRVVAVGSTEIAWSTPYGTDTFLLTSALDSITATTQNGFFTNAPLPPQERHDVAITSLLLSNAHPKQGENTTMTIGVLNNGTTPETFNVQIYCDSGLIDILNVASLGPGASQTLTHDCDTTNVTLGAHTVTVNATGVTNDADLTNNAKSVPVTIVSATGPSTDINGDGKVDMKDIALVAQAFGANPENARWNPAADVNGDGVVNIIDVAMVSKDFWKH